MTEADPDLNYDPTRFNDFERASLAEQRATRIAAQEQAEYQQSQLDLLNRGVSGIVSAVENRVGISPEFFDQQVPLWYDKLGEKDQGIIKSMLNINYYAAITRNYGMTSIEEWTSNRYGIRFERRDLKNMWETLPGFRMAMATMSHDFFEENENHFVLSKDGYGILQDYDLLLNYKDGLAKGIAQILRRDPAAAEAVAKYKLKDKIQGGREVDSYEQLARLAVSTVDNLFFSTGAYVSADEKRKYDPDSGIKVKLSSSQISPDAIRTFMQPLKKVLEQATEPRPRGVPEDQPEEGRVERSPLGPMGEWMRWNIVYTTGFKERVMEGKEGYLPMRMYFSMLDQTTLGNGNSVSKELVMRGTKEDQGVSVEVDSKDEQGRSKRREVRVYDFNDGAEYMDWGSIKADELLGDYADERSAAVALYKHLTSDDPRDRVRVNKFVNYLAKLRKHPKLNQIYNKEEILIAGAGLIISPERGFVAGDQLILDIDQNTYQAVVNSILMDDRLFVGKPNLRKKLLDAYHTGNDLSVLSVLKDIFIGNAFFTERRRLIKDILKKKKQILEELGESG